MIETNENSADASESSSSGFAEDTCTLSPKREEAKENKKCLVCGDIALGCNFGALSCESCKAFFRRNAFKFQELECIFEGKCTIDKNTRRFCTYCRLKKCQEAKMKRDLILGEDEKKIRHEKARQRLEKKALKRKRREEANTIAGNSRLSENSCDTPPDISHDSKATSVDSSPTIQIVDLQQYSQNSSSQMQVCHPDQIFFTVSTYSDPTPGPLDFGDDLDQFLKSCDKCSTQPGEVPQSDSNSSQVQNWENDVNVTLPNIYPNNNCSIYCSDQQSLICLNETLSKFGQCRLLTNAQWNAISDLKQAYDMSFFSTGGEENPANVTTLNNLINKSGFIVRRLINFSKKLSDFCILSQENQIALLKGVVLHTLLLLSATYYDVEKDVWKTPQGEIPTKILMLVTKFNGFYEEHARYCRSFRALVGQDQQITALMHVLCLFCPDSMTVSDRLQVSNIYDRYVLLLKHYLEAQYGYREARTIMSGVLDNIVKLQNITENHGKILMHVDPSKIDPLMLEIFNLHDLGRFVNSNSTNKNDNNIDSSDHCD